MEKECRECGEVKRLDEFYKHSQMKDGHLNKCKDCVKSRVGVHREDNIDNIRKYDRERGSLDHRVAAHREYQKTDRGKEAIARGANNYKKKHPDQRAANVLVGNAVRDGRILKKPCEICGSAISVHAHHDDYCKPLEVRWLCVKHHLEYHKEKRATERSSV